MFRVRGSFILVSGEAICPFQGNLSLRIRGSFILVSRDASTSFQGTLVSGAAFSSFHEGLPGAGHQLHPEYALHARVYALSRMLPHTCGMEHDREPKAIGRRRRRQETPGSHVRCHCRARTMALKTVSSGHGFETRQ